MHVKEIESRCGQPIAIEAIEQNEALAKCNLQYQSPLFSTLPREMRDLIWSFATAPVEDESRKYATNEYYCRPGHRAPHKTYTDLLYTCRRVWLEANALPMLQAEHCYWYYRAAPDARSKEWMAGLTKMNRQNFGELHLFAQMFAIEGLQEQSSGVRCKFSETDEQPGDFQPRKLHVTIRHTDWWSWESEAPLRLQDDWVEALLNCPDLRSTQTLELELETLDYKIEQLKPIVERLKSLESRGKDTHLVNGKPTKTKFVLAGEEDVFKWSGPADIDGHTYGPYKGKTSLNYHIVTLTWRLTFPDIPRAHVPTLRLAPRVGAPEAIPFDASSFDDPLPAHPRASWYYNRPAEPGGPSDIRRMNRRVRLRHKRGLKPYESRDEEDTHKWCAWSGKQRYVCAVQKYQGDVYVVGGRNWFRKQMAAVRRETWEMKWREEGSLLRFE